MKRISEDTVLVNGRMHKISEKRQVIQGQKDFQKNVEDNPPTLDEIKKIDKLLKDMKKAKDGMPKKDDSPIAEDVEIQEIMVKVQHYQDHIRGDVDRMIEADEAVLAEWEALPIESLE